MNQFAKAQICSEEKKHPLQLQCGFLLMPRVSVEMGAEFTLIPAATLNHWPCMGDLNVILKT